MGESIGRKVQFRLAIGLVAGFLAFSAKADDASDRALCEQELGGRCAATSALGCDCQGSQFIQLAYQCMKQSAQFFCHQEQDQCECRFPDGRVDAHFVTSIPDGLRGRPMSYSPPSSGNANNNPNNPNSPTTGLGDPNTPPPVPKGDSAQQPSPPQQPQPQAQQPKKEEQPKQPPQMPQPPGGGQPEKGGDEKPQFGQCQANPAMNDDGQLDSAANQFCSSGKSQVQSAIQKFKQAKKKCGQDNQQGNMKCYESCNQNTKNAITGASQAAKSRMQAGNSGYHGAQGAGTGANGLGDAMKQHNAECSAAKAACDASCAEANKAKDDLKKAAQQAAQTCQQMEGQQTKDQKEGKQSQAGAGKINSALGKEDSKSGEYGPSLADKTSQCGNDMARENNGAMKNLGELMKALGDAMKNAGDQKGDSSQASLADSTGLDCSKPENASSQTCICKASPRTPGCELAGEAAQAALIAPKVTSNATRKTASVTNPGMPIDPVTGAPMGGDSGMAGASGMGGGFSGGSGGGGFSRGDSKSPDKVVPNSNILAGIEGGGGGGGGGGWSSSARKASEAMRSYLPGGAKDPRKNIAGHGVTGAGGWSNWEKVRRRYSDKRATFLNEE